jgi:hypothetical protein
MQQISLNNTNYLYNTNSIDIAYVQKTFQRVTLVVLPFLSLTDTFHRPIAIGTSSYRLWTAIQDTYHAKPEEFEQQGWKTVFAVIDLMGKFFIKNPLIKITLSIRTILTETLSLLKNIEKGKALQVWKSLLKIAGSCFAIFAIFQCYPTVGIAAAIIRMFTAVLNSIDEYEKDCLLEAVGNFLMSIIRLDQVITRYKAVY